MQPLFLVAPCVTMPDFSLTVLRCVQQRLMIVERYRISANTPVERTLRGLTDETFALMASEVQTSQPVFLG